MTHILPDFNLAYPPQELKNFLSYVYIRTHFKESEEIDLSIYKSEKIYYLIKINIEDLFDTNEELFNLDMFDKYGQYGLLLKEMGTESEEWKEFKQKIKEKMIFLENYRWRMVNYYDLDIEDKKNIEDDFARMDMKQVAEQLEEMNKKLFKLNKKIEMNQIFGHLDELMKKIIASNQNFAVKQDNDNEFINIYFSIFNMAFMFVIICVIMYYH